MQYLSPKELSHADRTSFFEQVFRTDITAKELIRYYIGFQGPIFNDQRIHLSRKLSELFKTEGIETPEATIFNSDQSINRDFLSTNFPGFESLYFNSAGHEDFQKTEILPPSKAEFHYQGPLPPYPWTLRVTDRPAFCAYSSPSKVELFVGPNQYQVFDSVSETRVTGASLRSYSKDIMKYDKVDLTGAVVLVQDHGDGSNFSHFVFDWMTRIMHALEVNLVDPKETTFILGGENGAFQKLMISGIRKLYDVEGTKFYFPDRRVVINCHGGLTFFSDQNLQPLHPAQLAHPRSLQLLKQLVAKTSTEPANYPRVYISRQDAALRRIQNEEEIIGIAKKNDFLILQMSELPIEQQISIVRGARYIVGPHGMGLTHIIFNDGPLSVLELFHPTIGEDAYATISRAFGFQHRFVSGTDLNDNMASYHIDPKVFSDKLELLLSDIS